MAGLTLKKKVILKYLEEELMHYLMNKKIVN